MAQRTSLTMKEIAQRANVSVATISRVLNNREYVRDDVRQRVLDVMNEVGYEPDYTARSLRTRATNSFGFIVRDLLDLVFAAMAQGVDSVLGVIHPPQVALLGVGTVVEQGKRKIDVDGTGYLLERPLRADFALVHAFLADYLGNLAYALTARNFNPLIAMAGATVIGTAKPTPTKNSC